MPVARNDLGRQGFGHEAELLGDICFDLGVDMGIGADRARDGAGGDIPFRRGQALAVALKFGMEPREFEPHGYRLSVDPVAAAHRHQVLGLEGAALECGQQLIEIAEQQVGGARQLNREAGVEHIRRGHAQMDETCLGADMLGELRGEGDDIVTRNLLNLLDPGDAGPGIGLIAFFPDGARDRLRDDAELGLGVAGIGLDFEPDAEPGLWSPEMDHFGSAIAGNQSLGSLAAMRPGARQNDGNRTPRQAADSLTRPRPQLFLAPFFDPTRLACRSR